MLQTACRYVYFIRDRSFGYGLGGNVVIIARRNQTGERFFFLAHPNVRPIRVRAYIISFYSLSLRPLIFSYTNRVLYVLFSTPRHGARVLCVSYRSCLAEKKQLHRFRLRSFPHIVLLHRTRRLHRGKRKTAILFVVYLLSTGRSKHDKCQTCVRISSYRIRT